MAGNQVVLTFAGETKPLEDSFSRVGKSSEDMGRRVGESGEGFRRAGEAADELDTKAMGFRDTMTGVQDTMGGVSAIAKGDLFTGFLTLGMGIGDLGSGMYNTLIPAFEKSVAALKATTLWTNITSGATKAWAAVQWLLNTALFASPITWIIVGIVALIVVIGLIKQHTDVFVKAWRVGWGWVKNAASNAWDYIKKIPGWIGRAFGGIGRAIASPFRAGVNAIADAWNNTVGRLSWTVPGWVPGIGGNSISVPHLPHFHTGGVVGGAPGSETLAVLQAGEKVIPANRAGNDGPAIVVASDGTDIGNALIELLAMAIRRRGGNVQTVLGSGRG